MKKAILTTLFGLLLAVGWTNSAQAQRLPAESLSQKLVTAVSAKSQVASMETVDFAGIHSHSQSAVKSQKHALKATDLKTAQKITEMRDQKAAKEDATRPGSHRHNAPMRAGQELDLKSISKADADAITYTWDNGDGQGPRPSNATDVAKDPYQMYELLREVYTNKAFPGPYYSAYTKNDERERKVYYGAIEGGWDITGGTITNPTATMIRPIRSTSSVLVADGTSTNQYVPVWGYWYDSNQKNQMIYPASMLGLQDGDVISSITFYTYRKYWSGGSVKLSLGETTATAFSGNSLLNVDVTQVASVTPPSTQGAIEWTINFSQPYTYHGGNLLVQVETTAGSYGSSNTQSFYGVTNTGYSSCYSRGSNTPTRQQFLPKATFGLTHVSEEEVTYDPTYQIGDIYISGTNQYAMISSIRVYSGNTTLFSWNYAANGTAASTSTGYWPDGMYYDSWGDYGDAIAFNDDLEAIKLAYWLFLNYNSVTVEIKAANAQSTYNASLMVNGEAKDITTPYSTSQGNPDTRTWTINATTYPHIEYDPDYYLPNEEGYTALIVAVKNVSADPYDWDNYEAEYDNGYHDTKAKIINYLANNVDSIKLLTDGMRIGAGSDYSIGTLFNCEGTYNKFFFLGKGQARQKPDIVRDREISRQHLLGEYVPFRFMFEQFSPTSGMEGDETTDFYSKMNEGNVYNVIHDCRGVILLGHQFSMSGNDGTTAYAMTGMNFFIPDYRLKYWEDDFNYGEIYTVDGRITNPYQIVSADGNPMLNGALTFRDALNYSFWYAQYNQDYAPKVGLYKITLEATATQVAQDYTPGNRNYAVTLTWVSSLDEMTGHEVPQTYTVYYWDPVTGEQKYLVVEGVTTVNGETGETTLTYYVEQFIHSYTIDYIVEGRPEDHDHANFVAVSNVDGVVIPGWEDFVGLQLDHHESDFEAGDMANYYRNFLVVLNEDIYNGLTVAQVTGYNENDPSSPKTPMNTFNLYRWAIKDGVAEGEEKVAVLEFDKANATKVHYNIYYNDENHTDLTDQDILETPKYSRSTMGILDEGWVRVKGNGDLVIWPNGYHVNFKSIVVKNNGSVVTSWNADTQNSLTSGWIVSPGSKWEEYVLTTTGDKVGYMEGGGYIAIPNMLNNSEYSDLTVEIVAYGDGAAVTRIAVNDDSKLIANTTGTTYTWGVETPISPNAAPKRETTIDYLTVCDGQYYAQYFPIWGYYHDESQHTQMIYPASMLTAMSGKTIKSMTFYPTSGTVSYNDGTSESASGINFTNGSVAFKMANLSSGNSFNPNSLQFVTGTMTQVKTVNIPSTAQTSATTWVIEFDQDFEYNGGDLLIDVTNPTVGNWGLTFFAGDNTSGTYYSYISAGSGGSGALAFLPKVTFSYETDGGDTPPGPDPTDPTTLEPTDAGLLRLHLLMVDQFKEVIPDDNSHPESYGYVLRYEPEVGDSKQSGTVDFEIEKTRAKVNGYYTKDEIDGDTDAELTLRVLTADVEMDLDDENPNILYFEMKGKKDEAPASDDPYLTKLQYMKNIRMYEEMEQTSPNLGAHYDPAEKHHYFDDSTPIQQGTYGSSFMTYAPMVSTWGIDRRYFEEDGKDNTYGAPIWKNSVGKVELMNGESNPIIVEKQVGTNGTALPSASWTDNNGQPCCLYIVHNILADGYLPSAGVSNINYVPYMFRVFVESPSGKLRGFKPVAAGEDPNLPGEHVANDADFTNYNGPWAIYEENVEDANIATFDGGGKGVAWYKAKDYSSWSNNAVFGALSSMIQGTENSATIDDNDLVVYVRFYYMVDGWKTRDGEARPGNGAESPGFDPSPFTTVGEVRYVGEVVSRTYINTLGMQSDEPFDGINIVITRYSDGTTSTTKVVR